MATPLPTEPYSEEELNAIESKIRETVLSQKRSLLSQSTSVDDSLHLLSDAVSSLQTHFDATVDMTHYHKLKSMHLELGNVIAASKCLRNMQRMAALCSQLHSLYPSEFITNGILASHVIQEIETLYHEADLSGIRVVEAEYAKAIQIKQEIDQSARKSLYSPHTLQISQSATILASLGTLNEELEIYLADWAKQTLSLIKSFVGKYNNVSKEKFEQERTVFWADMEKYQFEVEKIMTLSEVLTKATYKETLSSKVRWVAEGKEAVAIEALSFFLATLQIGRESPFLDVVIVVDFPKLTKWVRDQLKRMKVDPTLALWLQMLQYKPIQAIWRQLEGDYEKKVHQQLVNAIKALQIAKLTFLARSHYDALDSSWDVHAQLLIPKYASVLDRAVVLLDIKTGTDNNAQLFVQLEPLLQTIDTFIPRAEFDDVRAKLQGLQTKILAPIFATTNALVDKALLEYYTLLNHYDYKVILHNHLQKLQKALEPFQLQSAPVKSEMQRLARR